MYLGKIPDNIHKENGKLFIKNVRKISIFAKFVLMNIKIHRIFCGIFL